MMILRMSRVCDGSRRYVGDISGMRMVMRIERYALTIERNKAFALPGWIRLNSYCLSRLDESQQVD
jgi:hypothetical protein